jgi:hypothetical protein
MPARLRFISLSAGIDPAAQCSRTAPINIVAVYTLERIPGWSPRIFQIADIRAKAQTDA